MRRPNQSESKLDLGTEQIALDQAALRAHVFSKARENAATVLNAVPETDR